MTKDKKILLIGGSGNLGSAIIKSGLFKNLYYPKKSSLNLSKRNDLKKIFKKYNYDLIINCAAIARIVECEKDPSKAIKVNIEGTSNLVMEILSHNKSCKKKTKLIHMSSDAVYPSQSGNYFESSNLAPYNVYGWTKLASEFLVKFLDKYVIIRTRFFDKKKIKYIKSAKDIFTSKIEVNELVKKIKMISMKNYNGILNIGSSRRSDYDVYKVFKKNLKPCKRKDIIKNLNVMLSKDSSMNISLLRKIEKRKWEKKPS